MDSVSSVEEKQEGRGREVEEMGGQEEEKAVTTTCQLSQNGPSGPPARLLSWE